MTRLVSSFLYTHQYFWAFPYSSLLMVFSHLLSADKGHPGTSGLSLRKPSVSSGAGTLGLSQSCLWLWLSSSPLGSPFLSPVKWGCAAVHRVLSRIKGDNVNVMLRCVFNNQKTCYAHTKKKQKLWPKRCPVITTQHLGSPRGSQPRACPRQSGSPWCMAP